MSHSRRALVDANVHVTTDRPWQAELRLRQARWREHLGLPAGLVKERVVGSRLPAGDQASNFLTPTVAAAVQAAMEQSGALISAPRIYDNMLSSQPLAFNLFGELAANLDLASRVGSTLWPDLLRRVTEVRFEWSPGRGEPKYLNNRSAFDVALAGASPSGQGVIVGIEVKYHEDMSQDPGSAEKNLRYFEVARASGVFRDPDARELRELPLRQIWFDHLLALSISQAGDVSAARFVLLAPAINPEVLKVDAAYRMQLRDAVTYERRTLEEVAAVVQSCTDDAWIKDFQQRYLQPAS